MSDQPSTNKRRFKNPETFRERVIKTAEDNSKPKTKRLSPVFAPFAKLMAVLRRGNTKLRGIWGLGPLFKALGFMGKIIFPKYIRNSLTELKLVTWPSFKQSRQLTYAVMIFAIVFGASIAAVDWGLGKIFKQLLLK